MNNKNILIILSFFVFVSFQNAKSPLPPPYYLFHVSGFLKSDSVQDLSNYTIQLYGIHQDYQPHYSPITGDYYRYEKPISLTDSIGYYYLVVSHPYLPDSIKLGLVNPLLLEIYSQAYETNIVILQEVTETVSGEESFNCTGCATTEPAYKRIVRYNLYIDNTEIIL